LNSRNIFNLIVGFTRPSCNFLNIVNSIPAFIEEAYFRRKTIGSLDPIQSLHKSLHPSVFSHSNILVVHMQGEPKRVVMEQMSCSVSSTVLGITPPKCTSCDEDRFVSASIHDSQVHIWCAGCGCGGQSPLPPRLVYKKTRGILCSVLPFPLPASLDKGFDINWPKVTQIKQKNSHQDITCTAANVQRQGLFQKVSQYFFCQRHI